MEDQESRKVTHVLAVRRGKAVTVTHTTWDTVDYLHTLKTSRTLPRTRRTPLLYHAFDDQIECLAAELPSPHVDDGYFTHEDGEGSIRSLVVRQTRTTGCTFLTCHEQNRRKGDEGYCEGKERGIIVYMAIRHAFEWLAGHLQRTCVRSKVARDISTVFPPIKVKWTPHQCSNRKARVDNDNEVQ